MKIYLIRRKKWPTKDFELTGPNLYQVYFWPSVTSFVTMVCCKLWAKIHERNFMPYNYFSSISVKDFCFFLAKIWKIISITAKSSVKLNTVLFKALGSFGINSSPFQTEIIPYVMHSHSVSEAMAHSHRIRSP